MLRRSITHVTKSNSKFRIPKPVCVCKEELRFMLKSERYKDMIDSKDNECILDENWCMYPSIRRMRE